jgi:catechol 2,3-dioxygenase-like lactoylglutathione lyase family enzyme
MNAPKIEHVNLTVRDPDRTARLMEAIFGWRERWRGPALNGGRTIHVGSESHYLALYTDPKHPLDEADFRKGRPLNHVGVETDDLDGVEARVVAAGLKPFNHGAYEPGRRFYFFDPDGIEFEVVSYALQE